MKLRLRLPTCSRRNGNPAKSFHFMTRAQEDGAARDVFTQAELVRVFDPAIRATECDHSPRGCGRLIHLFTGDRQPCPLLSETNHAFLC